ncbi:hypothetical protein [Sphingomonas sp. S-NIH.Pt15_0812]|uniref:hypothetical protein n=1 Tax=Sphingomonas sp. S-NIH.Pt15_0812 TaxID=1920129 RepID=UPI000F7F85CC|nr:hypothetical protein [Sphingomonas sp. S-NIH.Pt15_0812]
MIRRRAAAHRAMIAAPLLACLTPGCSARTDQPGTLSADRSAQLNDAAAMLADDSVTLDAVTHNRQDQP